MAVSPSTDSARAEAAGHPRPDHRGGSSAGRAPLLVWGVALSAYVLGVFHRSSLAVAGLEATERFGLSAAQLSSFVVLQLLVYAVAQVPVGLLVDRYGPRRVLVLGTVAMSVGQAGFALAGTYGLALAARGLVGVGDAVTFVCIVRLILAWFPSDRVALLTQLTGPLGQLGAVAATAPSVWALRAAGWEWFYLTSAIAGVGVVLALLAAVDDEPGTRVRSGSALSRAGTRRAVRAAWAEPGTRLGFWVHFTHHFSPSLLALLWGFPFLVIAQGTTEGQAGALLTVLVLAVVAAGPLTGWWVGRFPGRSFALAVVGTLAVASVWSTVLLWPGEPPLVVLAALVLTVGAVGPTALVGFEFGRVGSDPGRLGVTSAIINQGGFLASLVIVVVVGAILDIVTGSASSPSPRALDLAMCAQYPLWLLGLTQMCRHHRALRLARTSAARARDRATGAGHDDGTAPADHAPETLESRPGQ